MPRRDGAHRWWTEREGWVGGAPLQVAVTERENSPLQRKALIVPLANRLTRRGWTMLGKCWPATSKNSSNSGWTTSGEAMSVTGSNWTSCRSDLGAGTAGTVKGALEGEVGGGGRSWSLRQMRLMPG